MTAAKKHLNWGIIGAGRIAGVFAEGLKESKLGKLAAVASRSAEKAAEFAKQHGAERSYASYEALLADPQIDAVYLATPHPEHVRWGIAILEAGKHLLCEKPICLNYGQAMMLAAAASRRGLTLSEAFMYRAHPQTHKITELVRSGAIGEVRLIQANFAFASGFDPASRLWANELGGGGIMDVGCYPVSFARLIAGAATGQPFANPLETTGQAILHPQTGVDTRAIATMKFAGGILAELATGIDVSLPQTAVIHGSEGRIEIPAVWALAERGKAEHRICIYRNGAEPETILIYSDRSTYALEADAFAQAVFAREGSTDFMPVADTLGNMQALDAWRKAAGLAYEAEKPENLGKNTFAGRPLKAPAQPQANRAAHTAHTPHSAHTTQLPHIPQADVAGVPLPVSRLVMGCDNQRDMHFGAAIWDSFFEAGGNAFDTAWGYGGGIMETLLGQWMKARGVAAQCVPIVKGAHTPFCDPISLKRQLNESLGRLQISKAPIYIMHRDNPAIPVGEFVDALNQCVRAGQIDVFGGSNWTLPRILEANAYARKHGLQGFSAVSNNFSLAQMLSPVWQDCESASGQAWHEELRKGELTLLPWSSQARGFFTERAAPDKTGDEELVRCWYSPENFCRRERACILAAKLGVEPINIALAYVLAQPFPVFPLVGPRTITELDSCARVFDFALSLQQVAWLNLETDTEPA